MVKGISSESSYSSDFTKIPLLSHEQVFYQDTIRTKTLSTPSVLQIPKANINSAQSDSLENARLERLFKVAEEREKSMARPKYKALVIVEDTTAEKGSISRIYSDFKPSFQKETFYKDYSQQNFLLNISEKTVNIHFKVKDTATVNTSNVSIAVAPKQLPPAGFEGKARDYGTSGWYVFVLLISLSIFAWGKSLYQKYLLQIFNSVYNYQISIQLFRDKNALFRNLSIILQILFPINLGLLIYFLIDFYHFNHVSEYPIASLGIYSFSVFLFFRLKTWLYKFLGLVFKVQEDFYEIQHHLNIFSQSLGVVLLPFVISMPFLNETFKNIVLVSLFIIIGAYILLFFFRGFQIVTRKQVSVFFLIIYLCAVEILPVALLIKTSITII
jgi:hypothetical protein